MYTIKRAAELIGIPAGTLRAWQRRYGVVTPERSDSGYRVYDEEDLDILRRMNELVEGGLTPALAARKLTETPGSADRDDDLVAVAATLRPGRITRLLDRQFATGSFEDVLDRWLLPELQRVGTAWATGELSVLAEHLVASAVERRLHAAFDAAGVDTAGTTPQVLTGLPYGARHELGVLAFAVCLRRLGLAVSHLGANLPTEEWLTAREAYGSPAVVLAVPSPSDLPTARETIRALRAAGPGVLAVGGGQQDALAAEEPGIIPLGHRLGPAARQLSEQLQDAASVVGGRR
ncbi:MerR family transcriptional regulator [Propionibacteriaceae bacterium Y1700]|uniref:MerR family transcriptional regulator n=1 Tax=Microlunatus sp. Y1700 TaxID=3418487 RepID=UPI003DA6F5EB